MYIQLPTPNNMKNPANIKENQSKRKRNNRTKSIYSTDQNVLCLAEDGRRVTFNKPPFKYGKVYEETLHNVIVELSKSSNPINFK